MNDDKNFKTENPGTNILGELAVAAIWIGILVLIFYSIVQVAATASMVK